jgi:hypothetical protein
LEEAVREAQEIGLTGVTINKEDINMLHFTDGIAIIVENLDYIQRPLNIMEQVLQECNMHIIKMTKIILVCGKGKLNAAVTPKEQQ